MKGLGPFKILERTGYVALTLLAAVILYGVLQVFAEILPPALFAVTTHLSLVIIAMMGVHLLDRLVLWRDVESSLRRVVDSSVNSSMKSFQESVNSSVRLLQEAESCSLGLFGDALYISTFVLALGMIWEGNA